MAPQVPGLFYATKLQTSIDWWKSPQHFASKKLLRWVEHGVKVEFKKGLQDLCAETFGAEICRPTSRRLCDQRSSQGQTHRSIPGPCSRRGTVPLQIKGSHSSGQGQAAHRACPLQPHEATVKSQTTYEDLRMLKSVVRPEDFMLSLDVESAFFHVPIHPKHRKFFSSHLALPLFVNNKFIELHTEGVSALG